ncbi:hypothetical protein CKO12_11135 [Chromatium okenii]|uniref:lectin-like protein n=1 Tax=Chromatium okenii TaxID=61644 RepID=UPI001903ACA8|nr:lectin-like protein [Chromatium okenii]MBK1642420.1 hypothetical protein [Chromatium okenii]
MKYLNQALIVASLTLIASATSSGSVITSLLNPSNDHTYYLLSQANWVNSQAEALTLGGNLVTINDADENAWIYSSFANFSGIHRNLWIGFNDVANEGNFVWASGEQPGYTNWFGNDPDNYLNNQDFAFIINDNYKTTAPTYQGPYIQRWGDVDNITSVGSLPLHGVVEVTNVPLPSTIFLFLSGLSVLLLRCQDPRDCRPVF